MTDARPNASGTSRTRTPADGWSAHQEEQARAWLRLTPAERLAWLESAKAFVAKALGAARRP